MAERVCIRNADWAVVWDGTVGGHAYARGIDVAFEGGTIVHVGDGYAGPVSREVDGRGRMVMPGLVNIHSHPASEPLYKGYNEEARSAKLGMSGLYEYMPLVRPDPAGVAACVEFAYAELLASGVTTLVDLSVPWDGWTELAERSGLRVGIAPMYRSARWFTPDGYSVSYAWDEAAGERAMTEAVRLVERARQSSSGRLFGVLSPSQIDTCTESLLRESARLSTERGLPLTLHAAQSLVEFQEMTRRHGMTPIEWLESIGFLGPRTIVAHAIFTDHHSWTRWPSAVDIDRFRDSGTAVAHCPTVFARGGITLESFGRYRRHGIAVGIGTDTYPLNMLDEIRLAALLSRTTDEDVRSATTADAFAAATVGGAEVLGREDIGRLAPGAKADLVLVDVGHPAMQPCRDPLRSLVHSAGSRAVRDVYVDGRLVVDAGQVLTLDLERAARALNALQAGAFARVPGLDWAGRSIEEVSPLSLPLAEI